MNDKTITGYKNPPKKTQFKKGTSGNPNGRPRGKKNKTAAVILEKELNATLALKDGTSMTKKEAIIKGFVNNSVKSNDISKSAKAFDLISKIEDKSQDNLLASDFLKRLLDENYINIQDAEDFARKRKDPSFNFPKAIYKINNNSLIESTITWEAVKHLSFLGLINNTYNMISYTQFLISIVKEELKFWEGIEEKLDEAEFTQEEKNDAFSILERARFVSKPSEEILDILKKVIYVYRNNFKAFMISRKDSILKMAFFNKKEEVFFSEETFNKRMCSKLPHEKEESLEGFEWLKETYNSFVDEKYTKEAIDVKDYLNKKEMEIYLKWLEKTAQSRIKTEEAVKEFTDKYCGE